MLTFDPPDITIEQFMASLTKHELQRQRDIQIALGVCNAEFVTPRLGQGEVIRKFKGRRRFRFRPRKKVIDVETGEIWDGAIECSEATQISLNQIRQGCAKSVNYMARGGKPATCHGRRLMFLEDFNVVKEKP